MYQAVKNMALVTRVGRKSRALSWKAYFYRAQEFDHPHVLLQKETGYLKGMVQETGKAMAEALTSVARDCYQNRGFTALWCITDVNFSAITPDRHRDRSLRKFPRFLRAILRRDPRKSPFENLEFTLSLSSTLHSRGNSNSFPRCVVVLEIFFFT